MNNTGKKFSVINDELKIHGGGLYCFMPFGNFDKHKKAVFKIGLAINYKNRIESYHTYFPQGVYMVAFLSNPPVPRHTRTRKEKTKKSHYQIIEKYLLDHITEHGGKRIYSTTRVRNPNSEKEGITEWIYTDEVTIHEAFLEANKIFGGTCDIYHLQDINRVLKIAEKRKNKYVGKIIYQFV